MVPSSTTMSCAVAMTTSARPSRLGARDAVKMQQMADKLSDLLIHRGSDEATALFAAQIALACYQTAKRLGNNPHTLVGETRAAFRRAFTLGTGAAETQAEPPGSG
jgi:hypothetical protein